MEEDDEDLNNDLPSEQEIRDVFAPKEPKVKKYTKIVPENTESSGFFTKRIWTFIIIGVMIVGIVSAYAFNANAINAKLTGAVISMGLGPFANSLLIKQSLPEGDDKFGIKVTAAVISLAQEKVTLESSMTAKCANEKTGLKVEQEATCTKAKNVLQAEVDSWESKYNDCRDALADCGDD